MPVTRTQSADSGGNTGPIVLSINPTAPGGFVVVMLADFDFVGPYTISDDKGNTYQQAIDDNTSSSQAEVAIWYLLSPAGGINAITIDTNPAGNIGRILAIAIEYAGVTNGVLDTVAVPVDNVIPTSPSLWVSNSITTTNTDLLIGFAVTENILPSFLSNSPWNYVDAWNFIFGPNTYAAIASDQVDQSINSYAYSGELSYSGIVIPTVTSIIVSFVESTSAPSTQVVDVPNMTSGTGVAWRFR